MSPRAGLVLGLAVIVFALVTTGVGVAFGAPPDFLVADLATGMTFVAAGMAAVWLRPRSPAGPLLLVSGALWYVGSYSPTGHPILGTLGFAFETYYDLVLAALLLHLSSPGRRLSPLWPIVAIAVARLVRSAGRLVLSDPRLMGCEDCPPNPFALWPDRRAFEAVEVATNLALTVLAVVVAVIAVRRLLGASPVARRVRRPILVAGTIAMAAAAFDAFEYAWGTATQTPLVAIAEPWQELFSWLVFGARTLVPIGFLVGTLRLRGDAGPLAPFAAGFERPGRRAAVADALRTALADPSLLLLRRGPDGWTGEDDAPASLPATNAHQAVTVVGPADEPVAAIVHDSALLEQPELLDGVVGVLRLALENERLEAELRDQLRAVTESRARIVTATEAERRRLERDLHDGAQQRLIGVTLAIQKARAAVDADGVHAEVRRALDHAAAEMSEAIRELREFARGIHPAILEDEGLGAAVAALARRAAIPVEVRLDLDGRLPHLVESTAYFTIAEALTNAQRHARASHASVRVGHVDAAVELEVRDDGRGGAEPALGSGLRGLADRLGALGGRLEVDSEPGHGTTVRARIPTR
jgi:signal transduction histidine kinase